MANKEQLAILKQGVAAWNKWREENPDAKIDLSGARLDGLNLSGANFSKARIMGTSFRKAKLAKAIFTRVQTGQLLTTRFIHLIIFVILNKSLAYISISIVFTSIISIIIGSSGEGGYAAGIIMLLFFVFSFICSILLLIAFFIFLSCLSFFDIYTIMIISMLNTLSAVEQIFNIKSIFHIMTYPFYVKIFFIIWYILILCIVFLTRKINIASIHKIGITGSTIFGTDFTETNLIDVIFDNADLKRARFGKAILSGASFRGAQGLQLARCNGTIIEDRNVRKLLVRGNGHGLSLKGKKLQGAHLVNADLRDLDLRETDLMQANLSGADITGAKLYGSARENWIIDGIRCEYVYWDEAGEQRTPPDRDFRPGEFEELYKQLPSFEYVFAQGFTPLDPLIMDRVVQAINEQHKEFALELVTFDKRGEPHATFTVCRLDYVDAARKQIEAGYERNRIAPEQQEQFMGIISKLLDQNQLLAGNQSKLIEKIPTIEDLKKMGDTYNNYGQTAAMGKNASASGNTFQQITPELSSLHEAMRNAAANPAQNAAADEVAKAEQAAKQQDEPKMRQHLKNAGKFAVDCVQKIGAEALSEYLKKMTLGM